jgi:hypothetical protein
MNKEMTEAVVSTSLRSEVESVTPPFDLVSDLLPRLINRARRKWWSVLFPRTRIAWALTALVLALIGGTAYGATSLVRDYLRKLAPDVESAGLMTELNLSQTIDGVTVTLEQGYADANTVLLGYTITGRNARYDTSQLLMTDGLELGSTDGFGYIPGPDILGWHPAATTVVTAFDGTGIIGNPAGIKLRFETIATDTPLAASGHTWGPFVFEFTLPFHGGQNIMVAQTATAAGITVTLEKVLISPAGTSAVFHFDPAYDDIRDQPLMITSMFLPAEGAVGDISPNPVHESSCQLEETGNITYYRGDFTDRSGEWTLTIDEMVFVPKKPEGITGNYEGKASDVKRIVGPWVFEFEVP